MRRATLADYFAAHSGLLHETVAHRLRHPAQLRPESLAVHLELAQDRAIIDDPLKLAHLKPDAQAGWRLRAKLRKADGDERTAFACVQSLDKAPPALRAEIVRWLDARIGSLEAALAGAG
jgi:hypothetical protein